MANTSLASKIDILKDRAYLLQQARSFFATRHVIEVDCPALSHAAPIDQHIDVMHVQLKDSSIGYLHTSAEYGMKRLLADQIGDIYQISHVFRDGEISPLHNPEFMMVEWYRHHFSFKQLIEETIAFIQLFLGPLPSSHVRYKDTLLQYAGIDYVHATPTELLQCAQTHGLDLPPDAHLWDKDTLLQLLISFTVEPHLGHNQLDVLYNFPASQAALAKTSQLGDEPIAYRFEIYYKGIELANGYHELIDPTEQKRRLDQENQIRIEAGKMPLKIDTRFLLALEKGIPDCCGVAVGFDRLMLLRHNKSNLGEVIPFHWDLA